MNRPLALLLIGLVFGGGIGFVLAAANGVTLDGHDHAMDHGMDHGQAGMHAGMDHDHSELVAAEGAAPTLSAKITPDPVSGWNLHLMTTDFTFAPASAGGPHVNGEGHAHVYANGQKIVRVYGPWVHIDHLPEGDVNLLVTLNTNDHRTISVNGSAVEAVLTVTNAP
jgi:hypothetical protein